MLGWGSTEHRCMRKQEPRIQTYKRLLWAVEGEGRALKSPFLPSHWQSGPCFHLCYSLWRNWGPKKLSALPKVIQVAVDKNRTKLNSGYLTLTLLLPLYLDATSKKLLSPSTGWKMGLVLLLGGLSFEWHELELRIGSPSPSPWPTLLQFAWRLSPDPWGQQYKRCTSLGTLKPEEGGSGELVPWLCRQLPQQTSEQTWQVEAPITSVRGPHTHTGFIRNRPWREQAGTMWCNVYPPVCLSSQHPGLTPDKAQAGSPGVAKPLPAPHLPSPWLSHCHSNNQAG